MKTYTLSEEKMNKFFKNFKNLDGSDWDKILSRYLQPKATISYSKNMKKFQLSRFITTINQPKT